MTATAARNDFFRVLRNAGKPGVSVTITCEGQPSVVMMSLEEFEGWQETLEILSDPALVAEINEGLREMHAGETISLDDLKNGTAR